MPEVEVDHYMVQRMPVLVFYPWYGDPGEDVPSCNSTGIRSGRTVALLQKDIFCALRLPEKIPGIGSE